MCAAVDKSSGRKRKRDSLLEEELESGSDGEVEFEELSLESLKLFLNSTTTKKFFGGMPGDMPHMNGHSNGTVHTTLCDLLGVAPTATDEEIKKQYHKLAKEYHPDKNPQHEDKFKEITAAYKIFSEQKERRINDQVAMEGPEEGGGSGDFDDPDDISDLLSGRGTGRGSVGGSDLLGCGGMDGGVGGGIGGGLGGGLFNHMYGGGGLGDGLGGGFFIPMFGGGGTGGGVGGGLFSQTFGGVGGGHTSEDDEEEEECTSADDCEDDDEGESTYKVNVVEITKQLTHARTHARTHGDGS